MAEKRQKPRDREGHGGEGHRLGSSGDGALAVEAVIGELVSASHFPVSRENTGKFWRSSRT